MPRFAANLTFLFGEHAFLDRFAAARDAGFRAVEFLFPYQWTPEELAERLHDNNLTQALFNAPPGDWDAGERGIACLPGRESEFEDSLETVMNYATALDCQSVHVVAGLIGEDMDRGACERTFRDNLSVAAKAFAPHGITAMIEPINQRDLPGFFLRDSQHALAVLNDVDADNVKLQFDVYHAQITEGDLAITLRDCLPHVGHMQIANPPDRHEPGCGEIDYAYLFDRLDEWGYDGWIGCEYHPSTATLDSLAWAAPYGIGPHAAGGEP
jgi:hydroxypyruvate isomerase